MTAQPNKLYGDYCKATRGQPNSIWKRNLTCGKQASSTAGGRCRCLHHKTELDRKQNFHCLCFIGSDKAI